MTPVVEESVQEKSAAAPVWNFAHRVAFRFAFAYLVLYSLPSGGNVSLAEAIPGGEYVSRHYIKMWRALVPWVATRILHLSGPATVYPAVNGSGDSTLDYVQHLCFFVIAIIATIAWTALDFRRSNYATLDNWLRVGVRYTLAFTLFSYGFAKVFPLQFTTPSFSRLIETYGDSSPMGLLWAFMGYSPAYTIFAGAAEVTGGALLLFRRTTTLGALVSAATLLNVVMLNFCYDVPVKLFSVNLLLMALFLAAPDLGGLAKLFVLNRPAALVDAGGFQFDKRWKRIAGVAAKVLLIGYFLFGNVKGNFTYYRKITVNPERPPLYGIYDVETFTRNDGEEPPLTTDAARWKRMITQFPAAVSVRMMDDSSRTYQAAYDASKNTLTLTAGPDKTKKDLFKYSRPDPDHLILEGNFANDAVAIKLRLVDPSKFLLIRRGFHWINERPFNR